MSYHIDYSNNAPTQDGDHTQIKTYFGEGSGTQRPTLAIEDSTGAINTIYAENSGNDDDAVLMNITTDGSVSWDTIMGDVDSVGNLFISKANASDTPTLGDKFLINKDVVDRIKKNENRTLFTFNKNIGRHSSPEGGLDTVGFGHKLTEQENKDNKV